MLNIASVNMPKIKPETKVLIIKNLKSKSPAEVADIFNVSKRQVERIRKRYQETGDVHNRPRSGRPRKTTAQDDSLLVRLTATGGVDASDACTSDSCSQWSPRSYCCPETSAKQETAKKPYAKAHSLTEDWTTEKWILCWALSQALRGPSGPTVHPEDKVKFGGGKIMVWGYIQYGGAREIC